MTKSKICVYCNRSYIGRSSEHIVPEVLGGTRKLSGVCRGCNNGPLSEIDKALGRNSLLAIPAARHLDNGIPFLWGLQQGQGGLLTELNHQLNDGVRSYPQIVFNPVRRLLLGDIDEMYKLGSQEFERRVVIAAKECLRAHERRERRERRPKLILERIESPFLISGGYRYPPRIFSPHPVASQEFGRSMILRDLHDEDRRRAFDAIEKWDAYRPMKKSRTSWADRSPSVQMVSDPREILRGLMKLGFNLASASMGSEVIRHGSWDRVKRKITGEKGIETTDFNRVGFIDPAKVEFLKPKAKEHTFLVSQYPSYWQILASFFGGEAAASIQLEAYTPAPQTQSKISVPLKRNKWEAAPMWVFCRIDTAPNWNELAKLIQHLGVANFRQAHGVRRK